MMVLVFPGANRLIYDTFRIREFILARLRFRLKSFYVVGLAIALFANLCMASPLQPVEGKDYVLLATPQKVSSQAGRVEVLEFILFHCPQCATLDPLVRKWTSSQGRAVEFKVLHATFRGPKDPEVRLFHTLKALGELNTWTPKVFYAAQHQGLRMTSDNAILDWTKQNGLDSGRFLREWNSSTVLEMTAKAPDFVKAYELTYAPVFIVDGKFMTSPYLIKKNNPEISSAMTNSGSIHNSRLSR
jgi:protein dithiol oxidoreductase (disulfide-forming)